jgi:hypothetical protein
MGARLAAFYAEAEGLAGLDGKIQLAMMTRIPSTRALVEPDSPDNLSKFEGAMNTLRRSIPAPQNSNSQPAQSVFHSERVSATHRAMPDGEELFWGVLGSLHDALVGVYDRDARCLMVWESRSLEQRYPSLDQFTTVGDTISRLVSSHCAAQIRTVHDGSAVYQGELAGTVHGREAWFSISLSPAHDSRGSVLGVHAYVHDITEQKRQEEAIKQAERRLREQARIYSELIAQKAESLEDVNASLRRITEAATHTLEVARASVWFYDEARSKLVCADLFDGTSHTYGTELSAEAFPSYFEALCEARSLVAHDANTDSRTACFSEPYLKPLGITSMLDVPIWVQGEMVGVVCNEHTGSPRIWTADEENFAFMMGSFVSLALQLRQREG